MVDVIQFILMFFQWLGDYISQAVMDPIRALMLGGLFIIAGYLGRALTALGILIIVVSLILYAARLLAH